MLFACINRMADATERGIGYWPN